MLDAGGGGGGGGTYWYGIDPDTMWAWVNRDLTPHYEQATAWKKASELSSLYSSRLQTFRDRLAQAWNPETSPASQAYITKLDELITAVKDVDLVAGSNYQAAANIPNAISEAKYKLEPIYNRFKQAERDYDAEDPGDRSTAADAPANRYNDAWNEAAVVMYSLSSDLSQSQFALAQPAPYTPPRRTPGRDNDDYGGGGGGVSPPVIPPIMPIGPPAMAPTMPSGPVSPFPGPKAPDLQSLTPNIPPAGPPSVGTPPNPLTPHGPTPTPAGPLPPGGLIQKPGPAGLPPKGVPPMPGQLGGLPPTAPPGGRGSAPGPGVIGGGPNTAGRPAGGARANPVGGMIGGPATGRTGGPGGVGAGGAIAGRGPGGVGGGVVAGGGRGGPGGGAAGRAGVGGVMGVGGARGTGRDDEDGEHFDPDTQWDVAQGVAPVLEAPPEEVHRPIDPGPAIGLSR
jgi:hypothetical protein